MNDKIKAARQKLGSFFKARREEMGHSQKYLASFLGVSTETVKGVESGRFAWDIDLQHRLCAALEIKPYFSTTESPFQELKETGPDDYHGFYITENLLLYPDQLAIIKLSHPRLFVRFNYGESYFTGFDDWKANHTDLQWLDPDDRPGSEEEIESILTDCWNFLALHEREEERINEEDEEAE